MNNGRRPQLLLVEDEVEARGTLARALKRAGYDVVPADTFVGAKRELDQLPLGLPDVAVFDLALPDDAKGGIHLLEVVRERSWELPVVLVTAFADLENVKNALNLGASHLLEKPFRAAELLAVLSRVMAKPSRADGVMRAFSRAGLTPREGEIALFALKGLPSPEIALVLSMSEKTVRQHLSRVYQKLGVCGRGELVNLLLPI
ncbi:MAG: response regulator transcription factor [Polyangiaceae bacterium]